MEEITFEKALARLNQIASIIEENKCTLDEGIKLFEEGIKLSNFCNSKLAEYQDKLNTLTNSLGEKND